MPQVKYLIMDVDGTLTDGKIYMSDGGELMKAFHVRDGHGIHDLLIPAQVIPVIFTGRNSLIVENRCREIGISEIFQGIVNKEEYLEEWIKDKNISYSGIAYIGDDINDISIMQLIKNAGGVVGCPADAVNRVKEEADFVAEHMGGNGAVRDFIEWLLGRGFC